MSHFVIFCRNYRMTKIAVFLDILLFMQTMFRKRKRKFDYCSQLFLRTDTHVLTSYYTGKEEKILLAEMIFDQTF